MKFYLISILFLIFLFNDLSFSTDIIRQNFPCEINSDCLSLNHDECNMPICNLTTLTCQLEAIIDGSFCNDGLACTINDQCQSGICQGTVITCNDYNDCTTDRCVEPLGRCVYDPRNNIGKSCNNNRTKCFENNKCGYQGQCIKGTPKKCPSSNSCNVGVCDLSNGQCSTTPTSGSCKPDNPCMEFGYCSEGTCHGTPIIIKSDVCFTSTCDPETGLINSVINDGYCYINNQCIPDGTIYPDNDQLRCDSATNTSAYTPIPSLTSSRHTMRDIVAITDDCTNAPLNTPCIGHDLCWTWSCTESGTCERDGISPSLTSVYDVRIGDADSIICLALDDCHTASTCIPSTGFCDPIISPEGTVCRHNDPTVSSSQCVKGTCTPKSYYPNPVPINECHTQTQQPRPDHIPCDDLNPYTPYSACLSATCQGIGEITCKTDNPCMYAYYDPYHGCVIAPRDGAPCDDDNNACLVSATCLSGQCVKNTGYPTPCSASSTSCSISTCFPGSGCVEETETPCSTCNVDFDCPSIPCKRATCDSNHMCVYTVDDKNTKDCATGSFCEGGGGQCHAGTCYLNTPPTCDDGNDCTDDYCNPDTDSCVHVITPDVECQSKDQCANSAKCTSIGTCKVLNGVTCDEAPTCKINAGCNPLTRSCEYINMPDYSTCVHSDPCTHHAHCISGQCIQVDTLVCEPLDMCHEVGICSSSSQGSCFYPAKPNGFPCGNDKICSEGVCIHATKSCDHIVHDEQCQKVVYDTTTKACSVINLAEGVYCDTGNPTGPCSKQDTCSSGVCVDRYNQGTVCRDTSFECDQVEHCHGDNDECPEDVYKVDDTPCHSDSFCDVSVCKSGACEFSHDRTCPDSDNPCMTTTCDRFLDICTTVPVEDHTLCYSDSGPCIHHSECIAGHCTSMYQPSSHICAPGKHCSGKNNLCIPDPYFDCSAHSTACTDSVFDFTLDRCVFINKPDATLCIPPVGVCGDAAICITGECIPQSFPDCSELIDECGIGIYNIYTCQCEYEYTNPLCHPQNCDGGCTHSYTYWQSYNDYATITSHRLIWADGFATQQLCGKTTYQWLIDLSKGNAWRKLAQAYITAYLNIFNNEACVTQDIASAMDNAATLLVECDTNIPVTSIDAIPYRDLVTIIDRYNTGVTGPGNCIADSNGPNHLSPSKRVIHSKLIYTVLSLSAYTYIEGSNSLSSSTLSRATTRGSGFKRSEGVNESSCLYGDWDYALTECICYYGWSGNDCDTCATPEDPSKVFLCVPTRLENNPYLLRQIPLSKVQYYLGVDHLTLPFVSIPNNPAFYPGTEGYDCFCNKIPAIHHNMAMSRNIAVSVTDNQDLYLYIDVIESDLGVCELTWEGNTSIPEPVIVTVIIEDEDTQVWMIATLVLASVFVLLLLLIIATMVQRWYLASRQQKKKIKETPKEEKRIRRKDVKHSWNF